MPDLHRRRDESGVSAIELAIASSILLGVMALFFSVVVGLQNTVNTANDRSMSNDEVRLAIQEIDRHVRSGNVFYDPACEGRVLNIPETDPPCPAVDTAADAAGVQPGMALRVYTQSNGNESGTPSRCVQWRVFGDRLESRWWEPGWSMGDGVSEWRIVATDLVNRSESVPAFKLENTAAFGDRLLTVSFLVQSNASSGRPHRIDASITGRNTQFGYPTDVCSPVPPYGA